VRGEVWKRRPETDENTSVSDNPEKNQSHRLKGGTSFCILERRHLRHSLLVRRNFSTELLYFRGTSSRQSKKNANLVKN
jgi:hypothetical protein